MHSNHRIYLVGPMGSGKTAVGQRLAKLLDRDFIDTDREIEERCGVDVSFVFEKEGESGFRQREHKVLQSLSDRPNTVIATGGGIITQPANRRILMQTGIVIYLDTSVDQQHARTQHNNTRPLLNGVDAMEKLRKLYTLRAPLYQEVADITVSTNGQRVQKVARTIYLKLKNFEKKKVNPMHTVKVNLDSRSYPIHIGTQLIADASLWRSIAASIEIPAKILVISDDNVADLYFSRLQSGLADHELSRCIVKAGESSKHLKSVSTMLDQLIFEGFQRDAVVIALGGGVIGDMAGFAAACFMRGVRFIQVPTSLLAQVDSSVGGKTGVNHPLGKNLIGAFHQPVAVVIDTDTLTTLDPREVRAGLAEVIKYGCIYDTDFFDWLELNISKLLELDSTALAYAITRSCEIKADIVARDEMESGERALLNFGHSFGHAIEQATGYTRWLHGEAVAIGMLMASHLSQQMDLLSGAELKRITALIKAAGLPISSEALPLQDLLNAMRKDKKNTAKLQRLIVLNGIGQSQIRTDCAPAMIEQALKAYNSNPSPK